MKTRRFTAVLLCVLLLLGTLPLSAFAAERTAFGMIDEAESEDDLGFVSTHEEALERIYEGFMNHSEEIYLYDFRMPVSDVEKLFSAAIGIYPEIFFVERQYSLSNDYSNNLYAIYPYYTYDADETAVMLNQFYEKADWYLSMVDDSMDDFTKALILHDALVTNNYYQIQSEDGSVYSSNYTFMVEGWGRCENYAEVYAYLLAQLGIKSEIINSEQMVHEWMKINLGGEDYYYNVDVTWDDPLVNGVDRPHKSEHTYFLLSDEAFQTAESGRDAHTDYFYINEADSKYDTFSNLHSIDKPFFYINGSLYTLYDDPSGGRYGYIGTYDPATDELTNELQIDDYWFYDEQSIWFGNYSGIGAYNDMLYYNGENCVYIYNPRTGEKTTYIDNALTDGSKLYGMYVSDGKIYGMSGSTPNDQLTAVYLGDCLEEEEHLTGDINLDGFVDITDVTAIQRYLAKIDEFTAEQLEYADINLDGDVDIIDATAVQKSIALIPVEIMY